MEQCSFHAQYLLQRSVSSRILFEDRLSGDLKSIEVFNNRGRFRLVMCGNSFLFEHSYVACIFSYILYLLNFV